MENTKITYEMKKEMARQEAIDWQNNLFGDGRNYEEIQEAAEYFEKLGRRYGLLKEFRENGIC